MRKPDLNARLWIALLLLAALTLMPQGLHAGDLKKVNGRLYVSDYYSNDDDDFKFHVLTTRLNLYKTTETKEDSFSFDLDARYRKKLFNGDLSENVSEWRVDEAWLGYKFFGKKLEILTGRQDVFELYNTTIDGVNVKYSFREGLGIGLFGGLAPDKEDESLNTDFRSLGGYFFYNSRENQLYFGYENLDFKGETDREYFSLRVFSRLSDAVRLNGVSSASINQLTNNFEMENANVNLLYAHSKKLRFNIFASYYRTIKFYSSTRDYFVLPEEAESFFLDDNSRTRVGGRVDYKLMRTFKVYTSATYEKREVDDDDKVRLTAGFRKYNLYGFDLSGRYTHVKDDSSERDESNAEISRNLFKKADLSVYASHEEKKLNDENAYTERVLTYGTSLYWSISKHYYLTTFLERYDDDGFMTTSVFTQVGYKF